MYILKKKKIYVPPPSANIQPTTITTRSFSPSLPLNGRHHYRRRYFPFLILIFVKNSFLKKYRIYFNLNNSNQSIMMASNSLMNSEETASNRTNRRFYRVDSIPSGDHGLTAEHENKWCFEVAWEVVNKGLNEKKC